MQLSCLTHILLFVSLLDQLVPTSVSIQSKQCNHRFQEATIHIKVYVTQDTHTLQQNNSK